jgi:Ca2+-transporting ATPase
MEQKKIGAPHKNTRAKLVRALPFDYTHAMSGNLWQFGKKFEIYLKGAPERILDRCKISEHERKLAEEKLHEFAKEGFRVIAFSKFGITHEIEKLKQVPRHGLEFLGFVAIADELRPRVISAVHEATDAGVRVRMITGDHAETAYHIASKIDIADDPTQVYDSRKLMTMGAASLAGIVEATRVYARVIPEAKHKILTELNRTDITAMTGDGVNDVPALSQAHIGVAMGAGAAIAKDASDIVLLDNNFRSIVAAIREGRIIIANIRRMLIYLIATNAGEVMITLGALLIGLPLPFVAVQILWINLATDTFMVIPLGLEPGEPGIMKRSPGRPNAPILSKFLVSRIVVTAVAMAVITLGIYMLFLNLYGVAEARSAAFLILIVIQWVNAFAMRGEMPLHRLLRIKNRVFFGALLTTMLIHVIILFTPAREILHITEIHINSLWACLFAVLVMALIIEGHKWIGRRWKII